MKPSVSQLGDKNPCESCKGGRQPDVSYGRGLLQCFRSQLQVILVK